MSPRSGYRLVNASRVAYRARAICLPSRELGEGAERHAASLRGPGAFFQPHEIGRPSTKLSGCKPTRNILQVVSSPTINHPKRLKPIFGALRKSFMR